MTIKLLIILFVFTLLFVLLITKIVKKNLLPPTAVVLWIIFGIFILSIPVISNVYKFISIKLFGFVDGTHLIYMTIIAFLCIYVLYLTVKLKKISDMTQMLITHVSILDLELKKEKDKNDK